MAGSLQNKATGVLSRFQLFSQPAQWQQQHWDNLVALNLPTNKDENWKYTSLGDFFNLDFEALQSEISLSEFDAMPWQNSGYRLIFIDGEFQPQLSDSIVNVDIQSIENWNSSQLSEIAHSIKPEFISELTNATAKAGLFISVPAKVNLDLPIYIIHINSGKSQGITSFRHHLQLGELANCQLVEHYISVGTEQGRTLSRLSVSAGNGSKFEHVKLIEEGQKHYHLAHNDMHVGRDVSATSSTFLLSGHLIRHQLSTHLKEPGSEVSFNSLSLPTTDECFDTRTYLHHEAPHCNSYQLHKVIGRGEGCGVFDGMIYVSPTAQKTDGQMDNHNLLLGDKAQVNSRPKLEIYADDVKCSHGATTGQIDPEQVFYLQARGIPKQQAEKIITKAFATEVCLKVNALNVQQYLLDKIDQKLGSTL